MYDKIYYFPNATKMPATSIKAEQVWSQYTHAHIRTDIMQTQSEQ